MRGLYLSIIITVLGSLFFIGWGLDMVAEHAESDDDTELHTTVLYRQLAQGLAQQLEAQKKEHLSNTVKVFELQYKVSSQLVISQNIALPQTLEDKLSDNGGLLLSSHSEQYLLKKLINHPYYLLRINFPLEQEKDEPFNFILTLTLYLSLCGILILWLLPLSRRLFLLNNAAARIGAGELDVRIYPSRLSYIKMLEKSFNNMASQIEKLVADNKILARSLSHDMRTPIACLRFGLEAALDSKTLEKKNNYLTRMDSELTNMEDMTRAFLEYASMERHALHLKKQPTDIKKLLNTAIKDCELLANKNNITVKLNANSKNITYALDYHWSYRALVNLISNAISYANSHILLDINITSKQLVITIEDDGKGIANDKLDVIFTPFVKLDADRSREKGHFGLGLAICAKVLDWHQGTITTSNNQQLSGACFTLTFPLKE